MTEVAKITLTRHVGSHRATCWAADIVIDDRYIGVQAECPREALDRLLRSLEAWSVDIKKLGLHWEDEQVLVDPNPRPTIEIPGQWLGPESPSP